MKNTVLLFSTVFLISTAVAHAGHSEQSQEQVQLPEAGATPGSMMYNVEKIQESASLLLTFDREKKAEKRLKFARERLAEAKKLGEKNDSENSAKAMKKYRENIQSVEKNVENFSPENRGQIKEELNRTRSRAETVLTGMREQLPEQAMKGIKTALGETGVPQEKTERDRGRSSTSGYMATGRVIRNTS